MLFDDCVSKVRNTKLENNVKNCVRKIMLEFVEFVAILDRILGNIFV